ncbi:MAG TPA: haloacid dehalogenase-like hydrolase [Clostridiaceae bacterium]|jgi:hypothetical protein|nr:haloacid dehalogenase-like hydrolase [Clostridiaceae bacterium]
MEQNIVAIIWDFDKTLVDGYMQTPIFKKYGVSESEFWKEVNGLEAQYKEKEIRVNRDTIYLNHFLTCVNQGIFKGLNNSKLRELGKELKFYTGVPEIFKKLQDAVEINPEFQKFNIKVEHYIVSTGLSEMIKGSVVAQYIKHIWGCEFIEEPIKSSLSSLNKKEDKNNNSDNENNREIKQIAYALDNTSKTRAIFEINKGSNEYPNIDVNSRISYENRRVPFENMIYIADGPSDVPAFSVLKSNGGRTFAIYPKGDSKAFKQVNQLIRDGRIDMFAEADYSEGTTTYMWLMENVNQIASNIYNKKSDQIKRSVSRPPEHINE